MKHLKLKTKRFMNISLEIITGSEKQLTGSEMRKSNISELFRRTPADLETVKQVYANCYLLTKDHDAAKKLAYEQLYN